MHAQKGLSSSVKLMHASPHGPLPWPFGATKGHANSLDAISAWNPQLLRIKISFLAAVPLVATDFVSVLEEEGLNINSSHMSGCLVVKREKGGRFFLMFISEHIIDQAKGACILMSRSLSLPMLKN